MTKFDCLAKFLAMVWQLHDSMLVRVKYNGEFSDPIPVIDVVKQDCVLASTLFKMMFLPCSQMLSRMVTMLYLLRIA